MFYDRIKLKNRIGEPKSFMIYKENNPATLSNNDKQKITVFLSNLITLPENLSLYPEERFAEINEVPNVVLRAQKYTTWKLLEFATEYIYGRKIDSFRFYRSSSGKWYCDGFFFSVSHTDDFALLAVSERKIGIDAECIQALLSKSRLLSKRLSERILHELEKKKYTTLDERTFGKIWTQKEAIYKFYGEGIFTPKSISTILEKNVDSFLFEFSQSILVSIKSDAVAESEFFVLSFENKDNETPILNRCEECIKFL